MCASTRSTERPSCFARATVSCRFAFAFLVFTLKVSDPVTPAMASTFLMWAGTTSMQRVERLGAHRAATRRARELVDCPAVRRGRSAMKAPRGSGSQRQAAPVRPPQAKEQQRADSERPATRERDVSLDQPPEVHDCEDASHVHETMEALPASTQLANRKAIGGHRERQEDDERRHADGDEWPLANIHDHGWNVEIIDEHNPRQQVKRRVEEREQSEHAPELDEIVRPGDSAQRCNRQRDRNERDGPGPGLISDVVARVRGEGVEVREEECPIQAVAERRGGDERRGETENFDDRDRL